MKLWYSSVDAGVWNYVLLKERITNYQLLQIIFSQKHVAKWLDVFVAQWAKSFGFE
jgi:hypothetical protein